MNSESPVPLDAQIAAAERELALRRRGDLRWVAAGKMKNEKAVAETAAMAAIVETLKRLRASRED